MRFLDVHDVEMRRATILLIQAIELGNSRAERRSRVAAEDEDDGLLANLFGELHGAIAVKHG